MELKRSAQILGNELKAAGVNLKHTQLLDMVAKANGHKNWEDANVEEKEYLVQVEIMFKGTAEIPISAKTPKEALIKAHEADLGSEFKMYANDNEIDVEEDEEEWDVGYEVVTEDREESFDFKSGDEIPDSDRVGNQ